MTKTLSRSLAGLSLAVSLFGAGGAVSVTPALANSITHCPEYDITCEAPTGSVGESAASESTQAYTGLHWNFGSGAPSWTIGVRHTRTDTDNGVVGTKLDLTFDFLGDKPFAPTVRLLGVAGNRDVQGEVGFGISTANWQGLIAAGLNIPYLNAGVNYGFDGSFAPYVEVNALGRPKAPRVSEGSLTCESGYTLLPVTGGLVESFWGPVMVDEENVVADQTCYKRNPT